MIATVRLSLLLVSLILAAGCGPAATPEPISQLRPEVKVARVATRVFTGAIEAPGQWRAAVETIVSAPFDAVVESIALRPGDHVGRGQTIAWCRTAESDAMVRGAEIMASQASDSSARADARRAKAQARASVVRVPVVSPVSGLVLRRPVESGAHLAAGAELLALVADDALVFEVRVGPSEGSVLHAGMAVTINDGEGPPHSARVWTFPPLTAGDQSTLVWLRPVGPLRRASIGRFGTASVQTTGGSPQLSLPDSAVVEDDLTGVHRVAVVDSAGVVRWVEVQLGAHEGHAQAVAGEGLGAGTVIIVDGQRALTNGMPVVVRP